MNGILCNKDKYDSHISRCQICLMTILEFASILSTEDNYKRCSVKIWNCQTFGDTGLFIFRHRRFPKGSTKETSPRKSASSSNTITQESRESSTRFIQHLCKPRAKSRLWFISPRNFCSKKIKSLRIYSRILLRV